MTTCNLDQFRPAPANVNIDPTFDTDGARHYLCPDNPPAHVSMERWRRLGSGPEFVRLGGLVRYRKSALDRYLEESGTRSVRSKKSRGAA